jgi:hypothetical protein
MAIVLLIIGVALIVSAIRNTYGQLGNLLAGDFTGSNSFLYWLALLVIVGGLGLVPVMRGPSRMLLGLIVLAYLLKQGGFWSQLTSALASGPAAVPAAATTLQVPSTGVPVNVTLGSGSSGASGVIGTASSAIPLLGGLLNL